MGFGKMAELKALIVGCGYVGTALGRALVERGDTVVGVCRMETSVADLKKIGIDPVIADITSLDSLRRIKSCFDAVIDCVSSSQRGEAAYREVYLKGTINLLEWAKQSPPKILVFTSSTTVYAQTDGMWVDETSPTEPPHASGQILLETERLLLASRLPATILRLAGIYGPGRHAILDKLHHGTEVLPGDGQHYVNMIHRDDVVQAILAAMDGRPSGDLFNIVDDEPVRQADYVCWLCEQLKLAMVKFDPSMETRFKGDMRKGFQANRRVRNERLKSVLKVQLRFPNFRYGLQTLLRNRLES